MKTSFSKKLLACVMSLCMILTVCAGALSVSAETLGTATIGSLDLESDATEAAVPVTLTSKVEAIGGAHLFVAVPDGLTISKVELETPGYTLSYDAGEVDVVISSTQPQVAPVDVTDGVAQFVLLFESEATVVTTVEIELTFSGLSAGEEYKIAFTEDTLIGAYIETAVPATLNPGTITVAAAHVHTEEVIPEVPATCTTPGSTAGVKCSECGEILTAPTTIDATGHTAGEPVVENNTDATCVADGSYDSVVYCTVCTAEISRTPITVDATGHTAGEPVVEKEVAATCGVDGSYDSVVYCSVCKAEISRETITVPATGAHVYTYTNNGDDHIVGCENCDYSATEAHDFTDGDCVCGAKEPVAEPVIDEAFDTSLRFIVGISESVGVNVIFTKPEKYDSFKVRVNRNAFNNSYNYTPATEIVWEIDDAYMASGRQYGFRYRDVPLYAMSEKIVFTFEGYEDGVLTGISNPYYWRLDDFVAGYVNDNNTAAATKKLYSEVLWLGQYSWINFKNSAASTASIQNLESPVAKISTEPVADYTIPDVTAKVTEDGDVTFSRTMVGVTTVPTFKVIMSGMTADIRNNATFAATHNSIVLKGEQRFPYLLSANDTIMQQSGAMNAFAHTGIALYDSDKLIEFKVEKEGQVIGRFVTSLAIETYAARQTAINQGKPDTAAMYDRILILGEVARECFEK